MKINKTYEEDLFFIKATYDIDGNTQYMYYITTKPDGYIVHTGSGSANYEIAEEEMEKDLRIIAQDFKETRKYRKLKNES
jgi:NADH:ubiquinone oxidoreductase subunit D